MRIVCVGGGPAGLYFGLLMKKLHPEHAITVVERNQPFDTFGWGVVFSDATMAAMRSWDSESAAEIETAFNHWDDIEVLFKGPDSARRVTDSSASAASSCSTFCNGAALRLGVELAFNQEATGDLDFPEADLIVASDGLNSRIRNRYAEVFRPDLVVRPKPLHLARHEEALRRLHV